MRSNPYHLWNDAAKRCAICGGRFGLVGYYTWRTAVCSRKCSEHFKAREEGDRRWLGQFQAA
jgi:recombinational DNA repair protein (RecF pathway)